MSTVEILVGFIAGLVVNEICEVSPWLARKLVRWAAHVQYVDSERAELRAEELSALINERPGKLFKLLTALAFAAGAALTSARRGIRVSAIEVKLVLSILRSWIPIGRLRRVTITKGDATIDIEYRGRELSPALIERLFEALASPPEPANSHAPGAPGDEPAPPRNRR